MAKSATERMREYRNRIKGNAEKYEKHKAAERDYSSRVLSCFCKHPLMCDCYKPAHILIPEPATNLLNHAPDLPEPATNLPVLPVPTENTLQTAYVIELNDGLIGEHCVIIYEDLPYPGLIVDVDEDTAEVSAMCRIGVNRFVWPLVEDRLWYERGNIINLIDEPELVTKRQRKINDKIWSEIIDKLGLDDQGKKPSIQCTVKWL